MNTQRRLTLLSRHVSSSYIIQHSPRQPFSSTTHLSLRTSELSPSNLSSLRISSSRLWNDIHSTATYGTGPRYAPTPNSTGLSRLALTSSDRSARDWFVNTCRDKLGCTVHIDAIGNIFAIRPGRNSNSDVLAPGEAATFMGSHLDSQPRGGRFDGVLGVCAGIEVLRCLDENWIETEGAVGVVNWTNEEGARFKRSMMGSGVWAGKLGLKETLELREVGGEGRSVGEELDRIGYVGDVGVGKEGMKMAGHFELHIEQGRVLERGRQKAAVVEGVQGYKWFTITIKGREGHAGATRFEDRSDALLLAAEFIRKARKVAEKQGGLTTIGVMEVKPGSVNTVPGEVVMTLDVRHKDDEGVETITRDLQSKLERMAKNFRESATFDVQWTEDFSSKAMKFDEVAMGCVEAAAKDVLGVQKVKRMPSGAGHDSVHTNLHCPTAMIFVPCKDGLSHTPEEWCEEADCEAGTNVLLQSVLRFDKWRHQQGHFD